MLSHVARREVRDGIRHALAKPADLPQEPPETLHKDVVVGGFGYGQMEFYVLVEVGAAEGDLLLHRLCCLFNGGQVYRHSPLRCQSCRTALQNAPYLVQIQHGSALERERLLAWRNGILWPHCDHGPSSGFAINEPHEHKNPHGFADA